MNDASMNASANNCKMTRTRTRSFFVLCTHLSPKTLAATSRRADEMQKHRNSCPRLLPCYFIGFCRFDFSQNSLRCTSAFQWRMPLTLSSRLRVRKGNGCLKMAQSFGQGFVLNYMLICKSLISLLTISINCRWVTNVKRKSCNLTGKPQVNSDGSFGTASLIKPDA